MPRNQLEYLPSSSQHGLKAISTWSLPHLRACLLIVPPALLSETTFSLEMKWPWTLCRVFHPALSWCCILLMVFQRSLGRTGCGWHYIYMAHYIVWLCCPQKQFNPCQCSIILGSGPTPLPPNQDLTCLLGQLFTWAAMGMVPSVVDSTQPVQLSIMTLIIVA